MSAASQGPSEPSATIRASATPVEKVCLSTVTPVYQGAAYLRELVAAIAAVRARWAGQGAPVELIEAIFVDDGSVDDSSTVLAELRAQYPWVRVVTLARNFGQHPATVAGVLHSSGDWVATLDEDMQHDPRHLAALLRHAVRGGHDVVYARPQGAVHDSLFRDLTSRGYKALLSRLSGNPHVRLFNSFRMMRGSIARAGASVAAHETYFDVAISWFTLRVGALPLPLKDRRYGSQRRSGYRLRSLLRHARRLLISSEVKLLRSGALVGMGAMLLSAMLLIMAVVIKGIDSASVDVRGWTSLFVAILFFGGLTAFMVGIVMEYMTAILLQAQGKPTFFVVDRSKDESLRAWAASAEDA